MLKNESKKLVYVACPFGGKTDGIEKTKQHIRWFYHRDRMNNTIGDVYISPILAFGFMYDEVGYIEGIEQCLELLGRCDELVLLEGWEKSKGCCMEHGYAMAKGIPVVYATGLTSEYVKEHHDNLEAAKLSNYKKQEPKEEPKEGCNAEVIFPLPNGLPLLPGVRVMPFEIEELIAKPFRTKDIPTPFTPHPTAKYINCSSWDEVYSELAKVFSNNRKERETEEVKDEEKDVLVKNVTENVHVAILNKKTSCFKVVGFLEPSQSLVCKGTVKKDNKLFYETEEGLIEKTSYVNLI